MSKQILERFFLRHRGGLIGAFAGLLAGISILYFGFLRVLFVGICVLIGALIGRAIVRHNEYIDNLVGKIIPQYLRSLLDRILPPGMYR